LGFCPERLCKCSILSLIEDRPTQALVAGWVFYVGIYFPIDVAAWRDGKRMTTTPFRLRKHAEYQRVYKASRKQFGKQMSYFFTVRTAEEIARDVDGATGARIGLTVGTVMGKRRMREAIRKNLPALRTPVDVILHPRRSVIDLEFGSLEREVGQVFRMIQKMAERPMGSRPVEAGKQS
jgi:ribonuclease P protein component